MVAKGEGNCCMATPPPDAQEEGGGVGGKKNASVPVRMKFWTPFPRFFSLATTDISNFNIGYI